MRYFRKVSDKVYDTMLCGIDESNLSLMYNKETNNLIFYYSTLDNNVPSAIEITDKNKIFIIVDAIISTLEREMINSEYEMHYDNFTFKVKKNFVSIEYIANDISFSIDVAFTEYEQDKIHTRNSRLLNTMKELRELMSKDYKETDIE